MPFLLFRPIVLDGPNIAYSHGRHKSFSVDGLLLSLKYFLDLGHRDVTIFLPRRYKMPREDWEVTKALQSSGFLTIVERRQLLPGDDNAVQPYDDLHILEYAEDRRGIVVSNDMFRDVKRDYPELVEQIRRRCTTFVFVGDVFRIPRDPLGKTGPGRRAFLRF